MFKLFFCLDSFHITTSATHSTVMAWAVNSIFRRTLDLIDGQDDFSQHTQRQHRKHYLSGMHEPFFPTPDQQAIFQKYFPSYLSLLPQGQEAFLRQQTMKTPVHIKPLAECPVKLDFQKARPL